MTVRSVPTLSVQADLSLSALEAAVDVYQENYMEIPTTLIYPASYGQQVVSHFLVEVRQLTPFLVPVPGGHNWWIVAGPKGIVYVNM